MKRTAAGACIGAVVLAAACGSDYKNVRHDRYVVYSGSQEALRAPGIALHPHNIAYEPCPDERLPPTSDRIKARVKELGAGESKEFGVRAWLDQVWIAGKDVRDGLANAEIMVLAEVDDGVRGPVRTVITRIEDAPKGRSIRLQERVPIYPLSPLGDTPYRVRIRIIELDEGHEGEVKTFLDALDMVGDAAATFFSWVLPGGITELAQRAGAMDKNDVILDAGIDRIVPTLTLTSEARAAELRCKAPRDGRPNRLWRDARGVCTSVGADGPDINDLDFDPHKSFVIVNARAAETPQATRPALWYVNGALAEPKADAPAGADACPFGPPGELQFYEDTSYAVVRFEAALASTDKLAAEVVNKHHTEFRERFEQRVKDYGIRDAATLWAE